MTSTFSTASPSATDPRPAAVRSAPWPNRLDAGRYSFEGREGRAALDEPVMRNAIHGLERSLTLWADRDFGYLMAYTGDTVQPASRRRLAVAIEPMTCPPNALRSSTDVIRLDPGASWSGSWGMTPRLSPR